MRYLFAFGTPSTFDDFAVNHVCVSFVNHITFVVFGYEWPLKKSCDETWSSVECACIMRKYDHLMTRSPFPFRWSLVWLYKTLQLGKTCERCANHFSCQSTIPTSNREVSRRWTIDVIRQVSHNNSSYFLLASACRNLLVRYVIMSMTKWERAHVMERRIVNGNTAKCVFTLGAEPRPHHY